MPPRRRNAQQNDLILDEVELMEREGEDGDSTALLMQVRAIRQKLHSNNKFFDISLNMSMVLRELSSVV